MPEIKSKIKNQKSPKESKLPTGQAKIQSKSQKLAKPKEVGRVLHYFNNIKVGVIKFKEPVKVGDTIKIAGGEETEFKQKIASMQVDHKKVLLAKKRQEVGIKLKEKVREGYRVYKV
ncbi:MAG: hypothetical protein PHY72_03150 [Candidatus Pacebacteria bacterium]|nr:hypothetical protein [Candidatus Paceibacterota bacterium]